MKSLLFFLAVFSASIPDLSAQSRISIAPTYWFIDNAYSYHANVTFFGSNSIINVDEHNQTSSLGLTAHYQFAPKWDVSIGVLYYRGKANLIVLSGQGERIPYTQEGWQAPVLVNYQMIKSRLSPYFSIGTLLAKTAKMDSKSIRISGLFGVGLNYRFTSALSLLLQPTVSYSFKRPISNSVIQFTNYTNHTLGVQTQLNWHF
ncbi:outer membrane beta-barrel protein [Spirosoma humi]